jgi:type II secretory ATPase GspE/PulE/Tfp pilus assembly ATPase PilB-like protein
MSEPMEAAQHPWPALGVLLMRDGLVTEDELIEIVDTQNDSRRQRISGNRLGEILVERGVVTAKQVARLVAEQYELPFMDLALTDIDLGVANLLSEDQSRRFSAVPINRSADGSYVLVIADPSTVVFSNELRQILGSVAHFAVVGNDAVAEAIVYVQSHPKSVLANDEHDANDSGVTLHHPTAESEASDGVADDSFVSKAVAQRWPPLGALLIREGHLTDEELETALAQQRLSTSQRLGEILVERGTVAPAVIARLVAEQYELSYVELDELTVDTSTVRLLPEKVAHAYRAVPIAKHEDGSLDVAIADPTNVFYSDDLNTELGASVTFLVASPEAIDALIARAHTEAVAPSQYLVDAPKLEAAPAETDEAPAEPDQHAHVAEVDEWEPTVPSAHTPAPIADLAEVAPDMDTTTATEDSVNSEDTKSTVEVDEILDLERHLAAGVESALRLEPPTPDEAPRPLERVEALDDIGAEQAEEEPAPPLALALVVDSTELSPPPSEPSEAAVDSLSTHADEADDLTVAVEHALGAGASFVHISQQDDQVRVRARVEGALHTVGTYSDADLEPVMEALREDTTVQLHVVPTKRGTKIAVAPLEQPVAPRALDELGLPTDVERALRAALGLPGLVVVSGPGGSGVTSTLYAALDELTTSDRIVGTIEGRIERLLDGVDQVEIDEVSGFAVATGLEALCDADTDVILVSALPDADTAELALRSALAGRHVLAGTTELDVASTVVRLMDLGVDRDLLGAGLSCVVSQRLVRRTCSACRETYYASSTELEELGLNASDGQRLLARGRGCASCNSTGFAGCVAVFEALVVNDEIHQLMREGASASAIRDAAVDAGMRTLRHDVTHLCLDGLTSTAELERALTGL